MRRQTKTNEPGSLRQSLRQNQPFRSRQQETYLSILRTALELSHSTEKFLKSYDITQAQYNVLRILLGAGPEGLGRNEISQRMIAVTPDMTRLLDRLEAGGLVSRARDRQDKRQTSTLITEAGAALLTRVEGPLLQHHKAQLQAVSAAETEVVLASLEAIRKRIQAIPESP